MRADLILADLSGANLSHQGPDGKIIDAKNLTCSQLSEAIIDEDTVLPSYLTASKREDGTWEIKVKPERDGKG